MDNFLARFRVTNGLCHYTIPQVWLYTINPQFKLTIPTSANEDIMLLLESRDGMFKIVWGGGKRVATVTNRDIIAESGEYRRGCALAEKKGLGPGEYTVVASTFERGQVGDFVLRVIGNMEMGLETIRAETAGKFVKTVTGTWPHTTSTILAFPISAPRLTRISLVATNPHRPPEQHHLPPLSRITLQRRISASYLSHSNYHSTLQRAQTLSTSGPGWSDAPQGVRTREVDVEGRGGQGGMWEYWGVLERMESGRSGERYEVVVLADGVVEAGQAVEVEEEEWVCGEGRV